MIITRSRVMGQVYITVVAVVFLIDIVRGSVVDMLDKHVRTGILEGVNGWLNRRVLRSGGSS
jgi:hypothetical protein